MLRATLAKNNHVQMQVTPHSSRNLQGALELQNTGHTLVDDSILFAFPEGLTDAVDLNKRPRKNVLITPDIGEILILDEIAKKRSSRKAGDATRRRRPARSIGVRERA